MTYTVFKRSCRNWEEFGRARKTIVRRGLTLAEAYRMCEIGNHDRTAAEIKRGTKYEFTCGDV